MPNDLSTKLDNLDAKLDRMWLHLDFLRTRLTTYLGDGIALTYLLDETPIFVNSNDFGGPANFVNGGRYEEENLEVLLSFVESNTVFLDIGANLGFFSLQIGRRITRHGKVLAFEPHPRLIELFRRSAFLNGLSHAITCFPFGLSSTDASVEFKYPIGHLGGGSLLHSSDTAVTIVKSEVKRLDSALAQDFSCDLVKIDVEGHEIDVLRGMTRVIEKSPRIKILFEKLSTDVGTELALEGFFQDVGFELYTVHGDSSLRPLSVGHLKDWSGYVLAARPGEITELKRSRFQISASQLNTPGKTVPPGGNLATSGENGQVLFHGPYWFLRRGVWQLVLHGSIEGDMSVTIAERFGYKVTDFTLAGTNSTHQFIAERDLVQFECVGRAAGRTALNLSKLELIRVG